MDFTCFNATYTVKPLKVDIPKGRLMVVTGVSDYSKTALILESLGPGLTAVVNRQMLPKRFLNAEGIWRVKLIDTTPIGANVRSTVVTCANVHDELRKIFARTPEAKELDFKAGGFLLQYRRCVRTLETYNKNGGTLHIVMWYNVFGEKYRKEGEAH